MCKGALTVMNENRGFSLIELMVVVAIVSIVLAIAIPYYIGYKRAACDRAANADIQKLAAALERLGNESIDMDCSFELICSSADVDLRYFIGPYYGWAGSNLKCRVMMGYNRLTNQVWSCAEKGSRPDGVTSRYIYKIHTCGGVSSATKGVCSGGDFYGYSTQKCYLSSMLSTPVTADQDCSIVEPLISKPCSEVVGTD